MQKAAPDTRILSLLALLVTHRERLRMEEIFRMLPDFYIPAGLDPEDLDRRQAESARRKFNRDIELLRALGYDISYHSGDAVLEDGYRLENPPNRSPQPLPPEDLRTLGVIARLQPMLQGSPLAEALRMALARIEAATQNLPQDPRTEAVAFSLGELRHPVLVPEASREVLEEVHKALNGRHPLRLCYRSARGSSPRTREVDPWGLFQKGGVWYLLGWCHLAQEQRMFAMHRAESAQALRTSMKVPRPADFSLDQWASREPWELPIHEPTEVLLELDEVASGLRTSRLRSGEAVPGPDGRWKVRVRVTNLEPLIGLVLSLWGHAAILEPPEVRQRFEAAVERLIRDHEDREGENA